MRVDRPVVGTGEGFPSPHSRPKNRRHATDDKKPLRAARPPTHRAVKPGPCFLQRQAHRARKRSSRQGVFAPPFWRAIKSAFFGTFGLWFSIMGIPIVELAISTYLQLLESEP